MDKEELSKWRDKMNTRGFSIFGSLILICSGVYMCFLDLSTKGYIDLKSTFFQGKIETGSLGLMTIFFGVIIILVLNLVKPCEGQEIRLTINGNEITGKGLSYRKLKELITSVSIEGRKNELQSAYDKEK